MQLPKLLIFKVLSLLYGAVMSCRNWAYDKGLFKTYTSSIKTIGIGNLTVGGTGKTPHIEYLIRLFGSSVRLATLSRGYGRKTTGFLEATPQSSAQDIGDEPLQFYKKFGSRIKVYVCEKRAIGLQTIEKQYYLPSMILLDDVFQHRAIRPNVLLLITDYTRLFTDDFVLPYGRLREYRDNAQRADAVIVSKCPKELQVIDKEQIVSKIKNYIKPQTPIFFSTFIQQIPVNYAGSRAEPPLVFWLVSAIAQPKLFEQQVAEKYSVKGHTIFNDHHDFRPQDIAKLQKEANNCPILTTEKDWVKLAPMLSKEASEQFYYVPINVQFLDFDEISFDEWILSQQIGSSRLGTL